MSPKVRRFLASKLSPRDLRAFDAAFAKPTTSEYDDPRNSGRTDGNDEDDPAAILAQVRELLGLGGAEDRDDASTHLGGVTQPPDVLYDENAPKILAQLRALLGGQAKDEPPPFNQGPRPGGRKFGQDRAMPATARAYASYEAMYGPRARA